MHDEKGIECMRASGRLAAKVLEHAGTLVKVISSFGVVGHACLIHCSLFFNLRTITV